jgi:hypothetical protein
MASARQCRDHLICGLAVLLMTAFVSTSPARADVLRVMKTGLGSGTIAEVATPPRINCGADCDETFAAVSITLRADAAPGSVFSGWGGDCSGAAATCVVNMAAPRSVRAEFSLASAIPLLTDFTPAGINSYLGANPSVNTPARFIKALPADFKQNWILMSRSESLQTGTADSPRILMPSANAQRVFTIGMTVHSSYPGADPRAVEYMQWDPAQKNFRFHEIVLDNINPMHPIPGSMPQVFRIPARARGVSTDDSKCFACHSTRNVLNRGSTPGTDGVPPGAVGSKNKPNWDTYDSWGGMLPLNRDRIYQGSVEAAAFRKLFNLWTWRANDAVRAILEQLELQPPGVSAQHAITRTTTGGPNDGHINFGFDVSPPVLTEPAPAGSDPPITTAYAFDGVAGTGAATSVVRGGPGSFVTLHHSDGPTDDEGRGVQLFDLLGGFDGQINPQRIADELVNHRVATGNVPIDVRPIALAIAQRCITVAGGTAIGDTQTVTSTSALSSLAFFNARHGITTFDQLYDDTRLRAWNLPRRKADIQKINLDRTVDPYVYDDNLGSPPPPPGIVNGLIQLYGALTSAGTSTALDRLRQEVFRRPIDNPAPDNTVMGGIYVDRELVTNTEPIALYRYFLEPLGVSVDKWSMGVRGRSRTYTFADVFGFYTNTFASELKASLGLAPSLPVADVCNAVMPMVNNTLASLPPADGPGAIPTYTDIQRIFNRGCIECHGGLGYPPYETYGTSLDFSEDENPPAGKRRLERSFDTAMSYTSMPTGPMGTDVSNSYLYSRITNGGTLAHPYDPVGTNERCPNGIMPCGGPPLSKVDIETIRRWIIGGRPNTEGDPHIKTVDGVNYDFQSAGEFVLLRGENLEIQARQTAVTTAGPLGPNAHTGLSSCVSVNTAVALRVGPHRISYQPDIRAVTIEPGGSAQGGAGSLVLRIDGKPTEITAREIPLPSGGRILRSSATGGIQVNYPGGTIVVITPAFWAHHQIWYMNIDVRHARATEGIMGAIAPGNWLPTLPDGRFLGPRPADLQQRYKDLYETFADAWRVSDATSLFAYEPGVSSAAFTIDSWPMESPRSCTAPPQPGGPRGTTLAPVAQAEAEKHCAGIAAVDRRANCVQDVMATGEPGFAATYLATERIEDKAFPSAPALGLPEDNADVTPAGRFTWTKAPGVTGGAVIYRHCVWSANELYDFNKCGVIAGTPAEGRGMLFAGLVGLLGLILFLVLLFTGLKQKRALLVVLAILILPAVLLAFYFGRTAGGTADLSATTARLQPGKVYFWKVVAEDSEGQAVESQTRRFVVR